MATLSFDELVMFLIEADDWENSSPKLAMPRVAPILDDKGNLTVMFAETLNISIVWVLVVLV